MKPASHPSLHAIAPNSSRDYAYPPAYTQEPRLSAPASSQPTTPVAYRRARYPEYTDKNDRLISFTRWTFSHVQDPTKLVNYGFFYTSTGDLIRCYFCGLGLKDIISSDDPLLEHVRYSEDCEFLIQLLGPSRLREIKESLQSETRSLYNNATSRRRSENTASTNLGQVQSQTQSSTAQQAERAQQYRNPKYSKYAIRLGSYGGWPRHLVQRPEQLAEAGFYYTGVRDVVRCFACDGGLQKWEPTDDPWIEHSINFPFCIYLKQTKGENYIQLALAHRKQPQPVSIVQTTENTPQGIADELRELHIKEEAESVPNHDVLMQQVSDMGFKLSEISDAIKALQKSKDEISVEKVIDEIQRSETAKEKQKEKVQEAVKPSPRELFEERQRLLEQLYCNMCKAADINSLFLPCQHHRFCTACSDSLTQCPICGCHIQHKIKTYRP